MTNPVLVEITRGGTVESVHHGAVAVMDAAGKLVVAIGDTSHAVFPRSALKLLQAIPLVRSGAADAFGLSEAELALACASHCGDPEHVDAVAAWLARLGLAEMDLACGAHLPTRESSARPFICADRAPLRLHNNCSGKHTGFLTLAKHLSAPTQGYERPDSAVQRAVRDAVSRFTGVDANACAAGTDGCNAPIFALPLEAMARAMARIATGRGLAPEDAQAADRLRRAMRRHPNLVDGRDRLCTRLIETLPDGLVKPGAEGNYVAALPSLGLGIVLKIDDGAGRAADTAMVSVLVGLGALPADHPIAREEMAAPILNTRDLAVGQRGPAAALRGLTRLTSTA